MTLLWRKARTVLRFFHPDAESRATLRAVRRSGLFDARWYLWAHRRMHPLFRLAPDRHYVIHGEAMGLMPRPDFSPRAYLVNNPDLADRPGLRPFLHWVQTGRAEGRLGLLPPGAPPPPGAGPLGAPRHGAGPRPGPGRPAAPHAIVLHLHYPELWESIAARLAAQRFEADLFVTLSGAARDRADDIARARPEARIWTVANHGRDLWPFLALAQTGRLAPYAAVCKLHGKRSPHRADGADWREALIGAVLGGPGEDAAARTARRLEAFCADPQAALWVAEGHVLTGADWWGPNRARTEEILAMAGIAGPDVPGQAPGGLRFPAGSVYWMTRDLVARLAALPLTAADFEPEQGLVDGTTAHALERAIGTLAELEGGRIVTETDLDRALEAAGPGPVGREPRR